MVSITIKNFVLATLLSVQPTQQKNIDQKELACMTEAIFYESGNQNYSGKVGTANVIKNRLNDERFPDSVCKIVGQKGQFKYQKHKYKPVLYSTKDGRRILTDDGKAMKESFNVALGVLQNRIKDNTNGALFFFNIKKLDSKKDRIVLAWIKHSLHKTVKIEDHSYYKEA